MENLEGLKKFDVITLCGSTKFKEDYIRVQKELTLKGYIVITVGLFGHLGDKEAWESSNKQMLDKMHLRKIDMSKAIYVINKDNYIGSSTSNEIAYAKSTGKLIFYMEKKEEHYD